jgi:hypothetical protein
MKQFSLPIPPYIIARDSSLLTLRFPLRVTNEILYFLPPFYFSTGDGVRYARLKKNFAKAEN